MKKFLGILLILLTVGLSGCSGSGDAADWKYIENNGKLIIGITYFEPMNYLDGNGDLQGFETEFATAVCEILGVEPEFQEINWSAKETELKAKKIDCIWNGMTIDAEREENMSISTPYMSNKQMLVVKSENTAALTESVDGAGVVAEAGSAGETACTEEDFFADASFTAVDTQAKALMEVNAGTSDAAVIDYVMSIGMIGEGTDYSDLVAVEERSFGEESYGVAMRKEDTELTKKINDAMKELANSGKLSEIAAKYKLENLLLF